MRIDRFFTSKRDPKKSLKRDTFRLRHRAIREDSFPKRGEKSAFINFDSSSRGSSQATAHFSENPFNTTYMEDYEDINYDFITDWSHTETETEISTDGDIY